MLERIRFHGTLNLASEVNIIIYHFCRVHLEKSKFPQLVTTFFLIHLTKSSLKHSKFPSTTFYAAPPHSITYISFTSWISNLISPAPRNLNLPSRPFSSGFPSKNLHRFHYSTYVINNQFKFILLMITKNCLLIYTGHWAPQYIVLSIAMSHLSLRSIYFPQYQFSNTIRLLSSLNVSDEISHT